jgi:hypothetical protein
MRRVLIDTSSYVLRKLYADVVRYSPPCSCKQSRPSVHASSVAAVLWSRTAE